MTVAREAYFVYILANKSRRLYVGVTRDLPRRLVQHRTDSRPHFTRRYNITRLVYAEPFQDVREAIARERQLKSWVRRRKIALIEASNPDWLDLCSFPFGERPNA